MGQPIRIALLNGLQHCGLVAHMLGNKVLHNSVARDATPNTYTFNSDSGLRTVIPLHLMLPKTQQFDTDIKIKSKAVLNTVKLSDCKNMNPSKLLLRHSFTKYLHRRDMLPVRQSTRNVSFTTHIGLNAR